MGFLCALVLLWPSISWQPLSLSVGTLNGVLWMSSFPVLTSSLAVLAFLLPLSVQEFHPYLPVI